MKKILFVLILAILTSCSSMENVVDREQYISKLELELELSEKYSVYFAELSSYEQELINKPEIYNSSSEYLSYLKRKEEIRYSIEERLKEANEDIALQVCPVIILLYREELIELRSQL